MREKFVCVRITRMNGVNLRRFQFDYDTTWNAFFLDEKLNVYSRYGGRDETSPESRLSKASLLQTMREVLDVHSRRRELNRTEKQPFVQPIDSGTHTPEDIPLLKQNHRGCVHCHQIREYSFLQWSKNNRFDRGKLFSWPLPENVGLKLDRAHGHRIEKLLAGSPAEKALLSIGDVITHVNDVPIHSEYDIRWALDRAAGNQPLTVTVNRLTTDNSTAEVRVELEPDKNWRYSEIGWRRSLRSVPLRWGFRAYPLTRSQLTKLGRPVDRLAIRVISVRSFGLSGSLKLKLRDLIVSLNGSTRRRTFNQLKSDMLRLYKPGDNVRLRVIRNGKAEDLQGTFPNWFTEATTVP